MTPRSRLVIIGSGMAGARLAELIVTRPGSRAFDVTVFGDEPGGSYNRILLSGVLAGKYAGPDIVTHPVSWYEEHGIALHAGTPVQSVDTSARVVTAADGRFHPFDSLVFATGSAPLIPPIAGLTGTDGALAQGVFVFRTVDDCARMAVAASEAAHAVVIGGGLLGLEAARGLLAHGLRVTVVHLTSHVMDAQLDGPGAQILQRQLEALGLEILTARTTTRVLGHDRVRGLEFSDGTHLSCDMVVVAAGVRPNVALARDGGLSVGRGIRVDDTLRCTGEDNVYAIGDCAEHDGQVHGLVAPAWEQAEVLAARLTGRDSRALYRGSRLATKLKVAGCDVAVMGDRDVRRSDEVVIYSEPARGIYSRVIVRDDRVAGAILIGSPSAVPGVVQAFLDGSPAPPQRSELLFPPTGDAPARSAESIPDTTRICDCNAVTKGQIVDAVLTGARSLSAVCARTRAGTGCGSCRPEVQRIVDFACRQPGPATQPEDPVTGAVNGVGDDAL